MKILTISDTHGKHNQLAPFPAVPIDMVIHAGDCTNVGTIEQVEEFLRWYGGLPMKYKVLIAGNHDFSFEKRPEACQDLCDKYGVTYLNDSGVTIEGINLYGSPVSPRFFDWAFNRARTKGEANLKFPYIGDHWSKIPTNTDILITHGPPYDILDSTVIGVKTGCMALARKIKKTNCKLHVFGHIHESKGLSFNRKTGAYYVNASCLDERYNPTNYHFVFDWDQVKVGFSTGNDLIYHCKRGTIK